MLDSPFDPPDPSPAEHAPPPADSAQAAPLVIELSNTRPSRPPQPGLGLATLIVLGIPVVHLVTTFIYMAVIDPGLIANAGPGSLIEQLNASQLVRLFAFDQGVFVLAAFLATWGAFGRRFSRAIPFSLPPMRHVTILFLLVLPLAILDMFLAQNFMNLCENLFGEAPSLGELPKLLDGMVQGTPTWVLLMILAVAPALGEELVFRGVIGRGLIGRKGIVFGILWTSLLFSVVHFNPVQAVGVFFVGLMCHVSYLATRSLLAPILLHFLNNMLPVLAMKNQEMLDVADPAAAAEQVAAGLSPWIALAAAVCVLVLGCLLWKSRVQYRDAAGDVLTEDHRSMEPPEAAASQECRPVAPIWLTLAGLSYLVFLTSGSLAMPA